MNDIVSSMALALKPNCSNYSKGKGFNPFKRFALANKMAHKWYGPKYHKAKSKSKTDDKEFIFS